MCIWRLILAHGHVVVFRLNEVDADERWGRTEAISKPSSVCAKTLVAAETHAALDRENESAPCSRWRRVCLTAVLNLIAAGERVGDLAPVGLDLRCASRLASSWSRSFAQFTAGVVPVRSCGSARRALDRRCWPASQSDSPASRRPRKLGVSMISRYCSFCCGRAGRDFVQPLAAMCSFQHRQSAPKVSKNWSWPLRPAGWHECCASRRRRPARHRASDP